MKNLVHNYEMAVFKLKGSTMVIVLKPNLTKLIKGIEQLVSGNLRQKLGLKSL